jgi:hypothetical protein
MGGSSSKIPTRVHAENVPEITVRSLTKYFISLNIEVMGLAFY